MNKIAIFSDLHMGLYGNSVEWHRVALNWADWIIGDLEEKGIDEIFFLGDFFHDRSEISVQTIHAGSELISKFSNFNIKLIVGNHDAYYKNRSDIHSLGFLKGHRNIEVIDHPKTFKIFGKTHCFVPWNHQIPEGKYDYVFGHFEIKSFKMNNFKVCDHGDTPSEMLKKSPRIFSGHFHTKSLKTYKEGEIRYVGNCFGHDFNDEGDPKGYYLLDPSDGSIEFVENPVSPKFLKIPVSKIKSFNNKDIEGNIIKLVVDRDVEDDKIEKLKTYINKLKPFRLTTEYNVTSKTIGQVEIIDSVDIPGMFEEFYEQIQIEEDQLQRVRKINEELYERCK
jgi:DNA repair exonuclease SbcCD nuclease subunit